MRPQLPREDAEPWYRQFWLWFIILLPASVVVAGLSTLYIANRYADDLVVDDYYRDGLAINRQLENKQRGIELGVTAALSLAGDRVIVRTSGPVVAAQLQLLMSHPLESDRDFSLTLNRTPAGNYQATLPQPVSPRWHWTLELRQPEGWRLDGTVQTTDIDHVSID